MDPNSGSRRLEHKLNCAPEKSLASVRPAQQGTENIQGQELQALQRSLGFHLPTEPFSFPLEDG